MTPSEMTESAGPREAPWRDPGLFSLPSDRLLDELLARLARVMDADVAQFLLVEGDHLRVLASQGVPIEQVSSLRIPVGRGFAGTVAATSSPAALSDTSTLETFGASWAEEGVVALVGVPLVVAGRVLGVCVIGTRREDRRFGDEDIDLLSAANEKAAWAVENGLLLAAEEQSRTDAHVAVQRLAALQRLTAALADIRDAGRMVDVIVDEVTSTLGAVRVMLSLLDPSGRTLRSVRTFGVAERFADEYAEYPLRPGLPAVDALLSGEVVVLHDVAERDARYPELQVMDGDEHALVCVPLCLADRRIGVLALSFPGARTFDAADLQFLAALGDQCAHALDRSRLIAIEQAARERLELLAEAGRIFSAPLDVRLTSLQFARLVVGRIGDAVSVHLREPDGRYALAAAEHVDPLQARAARLLSADLPEMVRAGYDRVLDGATPALTTDIPTEVFLASVDDVEVRDVLAELPVRTNILLPLIAGGHALGVLSVSTVDGGHPPLTPDDVDRLEEIAGRLALALDGARLLRQQTEIAHTLQRSLLPSALPHVPGAEVAVRYLPGAEGVDVGGDFYDVIPLPSGRVGLVVGDVMGRGVRAAAVMGQLRAAVRAYSLEGHQPAALLARLDRLVGTLEEGLLVTALYAEWDPARDTVVCASAGHLPPLVRLPGREPAFVEVEPGVPLGVGVQSYAETDMTLPPGSLWLAFTDGLVEGPDLPVEHGMDRLAAAVRSSVNAMDACEDALRELRPLTDTRRYDDDTALLALVTHPTTGAASVRQTSDTQHVLELPAVLSSPARARAFVLQSLESWGLDQLIDTAALLTSELVTNGVRHAGTGLRLMVSRIGERGVRIAVTDHAPTVGVRIGRSDDDAEGGRGLFLVEHMSSGWGSVADDTGKTVWFELQA